MLNTVSFAVAGLVFGSLANVFIHRIPSGGSVWWPFSRCPRCLKTIQWHDNIPVASFIMLGGRCRYCHKRISWRYPVAELLCAAMFAASYAVSDSVPSAAIRSIIMFDLIVISFIDYSHRIIPDGLSMPLAIAGLAGCAWNPLIGAPGGASWVWRCMDAAGGMLVGAGTLAAIAWAGRLIYKKEALGGGDIKLMAGIGSIAGARGTALALMIASITGGIVGTWLLVSGKKRRHDHMPFGPFLAMGSAAAILTGPVLIARIWNILWGY